MKIAYVTLPKDVKFEFPNIFPTDAEAKQQLREDEKSLDQSKDAFKKYLERNSKRQNLPSWFSI